jgi:cell division septation protein DedD
MADSDRHGDLDEEDRFEDEGRRSIFSALWFRAILVVVVLGVVAAVAVPYLLEWANPQPPQPTAAGRPGGALSPPAPPAPLAPPPSAPPVAVAPPTPPPAAEKPEPVPPPSIAQEKPAAPVREKPAAPAKKPEPTRTAAAREQPVASRPAKASPGGTYFVQVGAFKDPDAARRLAARLRELKFDVDESMLRGAPAAKAPAAPSASAPPTGSDKYDVYVSGGVPAEINAKLAAKGLSTEQSSAGLVVKPSLPLRDAVALSKDLAVDGLKVQVRRSGGGSPPVAASAPAPSAPAPSGDTFYRVRVGPYDARADAASAMHDLEKRGYKPFLARAGQ